MTQQPESPDPIASAGQIDDPDQPTTVKGQDDSRAGRDTQPDESSADGDPDQPGVTRHTARPSGHDGKPPKAIQETGVPVADRETAQERDVRDMDSEALAGKRKFQPRLGDANPNISDNPADFPDNQTADGAGVSRDLEGRGSRGAAESSAGRGSTEQYETPEGMPEMEPVRHSGLVEERVQEQERNYDLGTTEGGERYLTPKDLPGA